MLDMGFIHDIRKVLAAAARSSRQNLLFSATFSDEIKQLADRLLNNPVRSRWRAATPPPNRLSSGCIRWTKARKRELLAT